MIISSLDHCHHSPFLYNLLPISTEKLEIACFEVVKRGSFKFPRTNESKNGTWGT